MAAFSICPQSELTIRSRGVWEMKFCSMDLSSKIYDFYYQNMTEQQGVTYNKL